MGKNPLLYLCNNLARTAFSSFSAKFCPIQFLEQKQSFYVKSAKVNLYVGGRCVSLPLAFFFVLQTALSLISYALLHLFFFSHPFFAIEHIMYLIIFYSTSMHRCSNGLSILGRSGLLIWVLTVDQLRKGCMRRHPYPSCCLFPFCLVWTPCDLHPRHVGCGAESR